MPTVLVSDASADGSIMAETISYDNFETYIGENESARSSILQRPNKAVFASNRIPHPSYSSPLLKNSKPQRQTPGKTPSSVQKKVESRHIPFLV